MDDEFLDFERAGYNAGVNPFLGEWRHEFAFPPVSYANKSALKAEFKERVRAELKTSFVFIHQVSLTINLYLNHEKMLETPEYGDLDNYAKSICDALKGKGGILIDDCQIQRMEISWIDVPRESYFELEIRASPDDFGSAELALYEMNDGLYYPVSPYVWEAGKFIEVDVANKFLHLEWLSAMTSVKRTLRHEARRNGVPQFRAFQFGRRVSPIQWAFHRTRVEDSGFELVDRRRWKAEYELWASSGQNADRASQLAKHLADYKKMLLGSVGLD